MMKLIDKIKLRLRLFRIERQIKTIIYNRETFVRIYKYDYKKYNYWQTASAIDHFDMLFDMYKDSYLWLYDALQDRRKIKQQLKQL